MRSQNSNNRPLIILIVENNNKLRKDLVAIVQKNLPEVQIMEARTADEANKKICDYKPDVVSLDYGIDGSGDSVIKEVEHGEIPVSIFFLTRPWVYGDSLEPYCDRYIIMKKWRPARTGETKLRFQEEYIKVIEGKAIRDEKYTFVNLPPQPQTPSPPQPPIDRAGEEVFGKRKWAYLVLLVFLLGLAGLLAKVSYELGKYRGTAIEHEFQVQKQEAEFQRCKVKFLSLVVDYYSALQSGDSDECKKCARELRNLSGELEKKGVVQVIRNGTSDALRVRFLKNGSVWVLPRATMPDW